MGEALSDIFEQTDMIGGTLPEDLFSILDTFEDTVSSAKERASIEGSNFSPKVTLVSPRVGSNSRPLESDEGQAPKKRKLDSPRAPADLGNQDGQQKTTHITVERNRRKQMNEHLSVLRSLMPCFYAKRGDQASIIGGVVDYIKELQQVLQSLEAKKQRKAFSEVLSPRPVCSSPRPPPLSPRMALPISPRTPQPGSPYMPRIQPQQQPQQQQQQQQQQGYLSPTVLHAAESSPSFNSATTTATNAEIVAAANSQSPVAKVEVKFSGPNVILKTISHRIPGQAFKIITALEGLAMEILHVSISTNVSDDIMLNSFTIKIGIECELSAEELAQEIQQTFL
ncbi:transcription factor SPEECHLESS-like [Zingiber officinale]|uniref:transcription factor SPEECHLESS-like n=1 Tax=Zingiber officinale TaxID=94328 RepID=UPI001C4C2023|nr:transcription factor SPEECHLESS-like [Zingiber officinale]